MALGSAKQIKDARFVQSMPETESVAWQSFVLVTPNFLGNWKAKNYQMLVEDMLSMFKDLGVKMSIKVHYLFNHLDRYLQPLGALNKRHGDGFHQDKVQGPTISRDAHNISKSWAISERKPNVIFGFSDIKIP